MRAAAIVMVRPFSKYALLVGFIQRYYIVQTFSPNCANQIFRKTRSQWAPVEAISIPQYAISRFPRLSPQKSFMAVAQQKLVILISG